MEPILLTDDIVQQWQGFVIIVPGIVQNLKCAGSSSQTELLLSWELPIVISNNNMVSYLVEVNRLEGFIKT